MKSSAISFMKGTKQMQLTAATVFLLLLVLLPISTVAAANGPELMVYSGSIPQGVNQGDGTYEISFSIYASEQGGSALWSETQNVYVYQGTFAAYLGAVQRLNLAFDLPYWVGVKAGDKEDIWPLTGAGYPVSGFGAEISSGNAAITPNAVAANEVKSANIKEADGTSGQFAADIRLYGINATLN